MLRVQNGTVNSLEPIQRVVFKHGDISEWNVSKVLEPIQRVVFKHKTPKEIINNLYP